MPLNAASDIPLFTSRYSGVSLYLSNASCQSASDSGGSAPTIGCHSVIDSPECVSRVTPPTTIIARTSAQHSSSQAPTAPEGRAVATSVESDMERILPYPWRPD